MTDITYAEQLLHEVMGVVGEDTLLPLPVLVNLHRAQLRAPLERFVAANRGRATDPWLQARRVEGKVEQRWPPLARGNIFTGSEVLNRLAQQLPFTDSSDEEHMMWVARETSAPVARLLSESYQGWHCCEPLILLHTLTWRDTDAPGVMVLLEMLAVELELDPAVEAMIREALAA